MDKRAETNEEAAIECAALSDSEKEYTRLSVVDFCPEKFFVLPEYSGEEDDDAAFDACWESHQQEKMLMPLPLPSGSGSMILFKRAHSH